jgi:hypothetical protein
MIKTWAYRSLPNPVPPFAEWAAQIDGSQSLSRDDIDAFNGKKRYFRQTGTGTVNIHSLVSLKSIALS